jgi:hypothetical protein
MSKQPTVSAGNGPGNRTAENALIMTYPQNVFEPGGADTPDRDIAAADLHGLLRPVSGL